MVLAENFAYSNTSFKVHKIISKIHNVFNNNGVFEKTVLRLKIAFYKWTLACI